jgi:hypothetical protein
VSHTPEQAKALWCPMVRHEGDSGGCFNRAINNEDPTNRDYSGNKHYGCACVADKCAMWRWENAKAGYCGLAPVFTGSAAC